jgi:GMP synthase (glutamine-hydrolysing)
MLAATKRLSPRGCWYVSMSRLRLAFLDASHGSGHTLRNFRRELDADLEEFDASGGEVPPGFDYDGVVVSGSRASVYWDEPWIATLKEWVGDAIARDLPVLGVCFGHQVVADVLGGEVADMGEYEIGYREVTHSGGDRLFDGVPEAFTVFTTHSDAVTELPPGAEQTAENEYGVHGFRKGHVFGVQFHPEYDEGTAEEVTRGKDLDDEKMARVLDGITDENYRAACEAKRVFENFTDYVREVRPEPATAD